MGDLRPKRAGPAWRRGSMRGDWQSITPAEVLTYTKPTDGFLCPLSANTYGVEFLEFEIKDYDTNNCVFKVARDGEADVIPDHMLTKEMEEAMRSVRYHFDASFLRFKTVRTALKFSVGGEPVPIYPMPENSEVDIEEFVSNPYAHKSDSFYFVNDQLIMHNKAEYAFSQS